MQPIIYETPDGGIVLDSGVDRSLLHPTATNVRVEVKITAYHWEEAIVAMLWSPED